MRVVADQDVEGAVSVIRRVLESADWVELLQLVEVRFVTFRELGLPHDAPDRLVWETCQSEDVILVTGNRASGPDSLDAAIGRSRAESLPVLTIADAQRVLRDSRYADAVAIRVLDYLDRIDSLRGTGRLYVP